MEDEKEAEDEDTSPAADLKLLREILSAEGFFSIELFSWQGDGYACVPIGGGHETFAIASRGFRAWLRQQFRDGNKNRHPSTHALRTAINQIADQAADEKEQRIWRRVGTDGKAWYIDLCNEAREVIEIHQGDWERTNRAKIRLIRNRAMRSFPQVRRTGSIDGDTGLLDTRRAAAHRQIFRKFAQLLNLAAADDFQLLMAWCVCALSPEGPYPVLVVSGEQGSAKSTLVRLVHELIDPSHAPLRSLPSSEKDLFVAAANAHLLAFDNVSAISPAASDNLCKISTGGAVAMRRTGTDTDEIYLEFKAPIILNGIGDLILRPDLADRALFINMTAIPAEARRDEPTINQEFRELAPRLTEALFDMLALARYQFIVLDATKLPRMADFARIGIAIEDLFGGQGSFMAAYDKNRAAATDDLAEVDPVLMTCLELWDENNNAWSGTIQDLQAEIARRMKASGLRVPIPTGLAQISSHVKRITPLLTKNGLNVAFQRATTKDRRRTLSLF